MTNNIQSTNQSIDKSIINNNNNYNNHHQLDNFKLGSILKTLLEGELMRKWGGDGVHKKNKNFKGCVQNIEMSSRAVHKILTENYQK